MTNIGAEGWGIKSDNGVLISKKIATLLPSGKRITLLGNELAIADGTSRVLVPTSGGFVDFIKEDFDVIVEILQNWKMLDNPIPPEYSHIPIVEIHWSKLGQN